MEHLRGMLSIADERVSEINDLLTDPNNEIVTELLELVERFGGPKAINAKAEQARKLDNLMGRLKESGSTYVDDLKWLTEQRYKENFVSLDEYRNRVLGDSKVEIDDSNAVTLEISSCSFFPWLIAEAKRAIDKRELMPGRYIRVRNMAEQVQDNGDTLAMAAAMQIIGASYVETLDTKGTDGSNIHLGGPETITGYFGGIGQPNEHPIKWAEEYLNYYTKYGITQVLNINSGTILVAYLMHKLGINNEFKISVFMGNDNPFAVLWTLMAARMFSRTDGTTSLIGFNFSNSINAETIRQSAKIRNKLGLDDVVRFEHHITETYQSIVVQPYNRRDELLEVAKEVPNISAKHEGGEPEIEATKDHPSSILDYFIPKADILEQGLMDALIDNYLEKHNSVNLTADALTRNGIGVVCANMLHK